MEPMGAVEVLMDLVRRGHTIIELVLDNDGNTIRKIRVSKVADLLSLLKCCLGKSKMFIMKYSHY